MHSKDRPGLHAVVMATLLLAGCSGGGGGGTATPSLSFTEIEALAAELGEEIDGLDVTAPEDIPSQGSATYEGVGRFALGDASDDGDEILSQMTLNVDFASEDLDGRFYNNRLRDHGRLRGDIDISDGQIVDGLLTAEAEGRLREGDLRHDVSADLLGVFYDDDAGYVGGLATGEITTDDEARDLIGAFLGEEE